MVEIRRRETGAVLMRVGGSTLAGAYLAGAELFGADLARADLTGAELQGAQLDDADLTRATLSGANLRGGSLSRAIFRAANLSRASLWGAACVGADFRRAALHGADLSGANLARANLRAARFRRGDRYATLRGTNLVYADLRWADLSLGYFLGANLAHADLRWANLCGANFSKANLADAKLRWAAYGYAARGRGFSTMGTIWGDVQPESFDPYYHGALVGWLSSWAQVAAERVRWGLLRKRHEMQEQRRHYTNPGFLNIRTVSAEELNTILDLAGEMVDYTGGSIEKSTDYEASAGGERHHVVCVIAPHASNEELQEIWRRIGAGEAPGVAFHAVRGASYQFRERLRAEMRRGWRESGSSQLIEIRHKRTGEVLHRASGDSLAGADLAGAELDGANLAGADLRGAELQGARLEGADLTGAILRGADLRGVSLDRSSLQAADLAEARLQGALCSRANLTAANLRAADLSGALLSSSNLRDADLRSANLAGTYLSARLFGADLTGTQPGSAFIDQAGYDAHTRWPDGFDPRRHRAWRIGWLLPQPEPEELTVEEALALEIAEHAVAANSRSDPSVVYEYSARPDGDGWAVVAHMVENCGPDGKPGGYIRGGRRVIMIDRGGRVTQYIPTY